MTRSHSICFDPSSFSAGLQDPSVTVRSPFSVPTSASVLGHCRSPFSVPTSASVLGHCRSPFSVPTSASESPRDSCSCRFLKSWSPVASFSTNSVGRTVVSSVMDNLLLINMLSKATPSVLVGVNVANALIISNLSATGPRTQVTEVDLLFLIHCDVEINICEICETLSVQTNRDPGAKQGAFAPRCLKNR